jgi:hypothetical protein
MMSRLAQWEAHKRRVEIARSMAIRVPIYIECTVVGLTKPVSERAHWLAVQLNAFIRYTRWNCSNPKAYTASPRNRLVLRAHIARWGAFYAESCTDVRLGLAPGDLRLEDLEIPFGSRPVFSSRFVRIEVA